MIQPSCSDNTIDEIPTLEDLTFTVNVLEKLSRGRTPDLTRAEKYLAGRLASSLLTGLYPSQATSLEYESLYDDRANTVFLVHHAKGDPILPWTLFYGDLEARVESSEVTPSILQYMEEDLKHKPKVVVDHSLTTSRWHICVIGGKDTLLASGHTEREALEDIAHQWSLYSAGRDLLDWDEVFRQTGVRAYIEQEIYRQFLIQEMPLEH